MAPGIHLAYSLSFVIIITLKQIASCQEASNCTNATTFHNGQIVSKCCVFPFVYNGELHNNCIKADGDSWCSSTANFDLDHKKVVCAISNQGDSGSDSGQEKCHTFPSGLSSLNGGPKDVVTPWNIQCLPSYAMTSFWDDVNRFRTLGDVKCCRSSADHNISRVFNLSSQDGGSDDVNMPWKAQCPANYIIIGLYKEVSSKFKMLQGLSAVKCSLVLDSYIDYGTCTAVHLSDNTGGSRHPGVTWKAECPPEHFIVGLYNDKTFLMGVKMIKCCQVKAFVLNQRLYTFEQGPSKFWSLEINKPHRNWGIHNAIMLENGDHTLRRTSGHVLLYKSNGSSSSSSNITSIGIRSSKQRKCLSFWFVIQKFTRLSVLSFRYNELLHLPAHESIGGIEGKGSSKWLEKQFVLPSNTNYQLIINGFTSVSDPGVIALDDIMIKPLQFCTGVCSSLGPLQGSSSIHDGPIVLWQASCLQGNAPMTSALTGLWDKQGSHFKVVEYMKCCNMPVKETYMISLVGREGGPIKEDVPWNAQCRDNYVVTGIYSLNKFNGLYQLQCGALHQSRANYSKCVVIWGEVRNHEGHTIQLHLECPPNMAVIAMYDHHGDNNQTSFADIDAIKCCDVIMPNCVNTDDCHSNADCILNNDVNKCVCKDGYQGNGKFCVKKSQMLPTASTKPTRRTESTLSSTREYTPTRANTDAIINNLSPTPYIHNPRGSDSTSSFQVHKQPTNHKSIIVILSIISAVLFIAIVLGVFVWRVRKATHARHRITGSRCVKEAEMAPINHIKSYDNLCEQKDEQKNDGSSVVLRTVEVDIQDAIVRKASRTRKARSATVLSADHPYVDEKDLDSKQRLGQPFYFELDKTTNQKNYTLHRSLALPEPMYGVLEPETESSNGDETGAQFCTPAKTEEELYLQLSRAIQRDKIEVGSEKLGSGAFGHVWLGVWQKSAGIPVQVAVKILRDSHSADNKIKFLQEAAIMRQFTHKNVIYLYGTVTTSQPVMIILEYMSRGNLKNYLRSLNTKFGEDVVLQSDTRAQFLRMARDISAGMSYLHSLSFVHRDLAARNILLDSDMTCKIGDFGMSRDLVESDYYTSRGGRIPVKWTAPEAINFGKYSSSSDIWSYGVVLYEIWSLGHKPYLNLDNNEVIEAVSHGYRLPPPLNCPNMVYRLMVDCWHPDFQLRPRSYQIHHCLCFSHQSVFLDDSFCNSQQHHHLPELESARNTRTQSYTDLKYVYASEE